MDDRDDTATEEVFLFIPKCCKLRATDKTFCLNVFFSDSLKVSSTYFPCFRQPFLGSFGEKLCSERMIWMKMKSDLKKG